MPKYTFTVESDDSLDINTISIHSRALELLEALQDAHSVIKTKAEGLESSTFSPKVLPAEPPKSWSEVLEVFDQEIAGVSDLVG